MADLTPVTHRELQ